MGIGTRPEEVDATATTMGCSIFSTHFVHLRVKVRCVMSIVNYWDDVVTKVSSRLSKWKLKTLSIAIYGKDGALNSPSSLSKRSPWLDIIREVTILRTKGNNLFDLIRKKVGNGLNTLFWEDPWLDDLALKHKFPRLYALDSYKQITVIKKINHAFMVDTFRRPPRGGVEEEQLGEFSVKSVCQLINDSILPKEEVATRWVKVMSIKINVFAWRVRLDKLSTLLNIFLKGIDILTIVCPLCHASVESGYKYREAWHSGMSKPHALAAMARLLRFKGMT
ncbi:RNA-directed DNA polymerase, eukaryota, reverse transcriptase zinc-binding domain protein [Tanacetum coccineum]|uniref:RNA-directed DNA polymerase, eukaryota, reverse transcriptase zinc-binding domain protein n=1 Tax=Tanacetum coccineum TaxID=301880 RepID=A0ABQ5EPC3_9ASTR